MSLSLSSTIPSGPWPLAPFGSGRGPCPLCLRTQSSLLWFREETPPAQPHTRPLNLDCLLKSFSLHLASGLCTWSRITDPSLQLFYSRSSKNRNSVPVFLPTPFGGISPWNPCSLDEIWLLPSCCWSLLAPPHIFNCLRWWFSLPARLYLSKLLHQIFWGCGGAGEPDVFIYTL